MPYKDKTKDRLWHKQHMRTKRRILKLNSRVVTPSTLKPLHPTDADGNVIYDD
jgi:hypothetical protein